MLRARADIETAAELEEIRLSFSATSPQDRQDLGSPGHWYADAFRRYGIDLRALKPTEAAARVRHSAIRETLLTFLYDWLFFSDSDADKDQLRAVLDRSDDDDWRRRLRETLRGAYDPGLRKQLLRAREALNQPPLLLGGLALIMKHGPEKEEARALLLAAQQHHPEDFWINFYVGYTLLEELPQEAVGYFRVAVASRPERSQPRVMLGRALLGAGDADGAIAVFRGARALNPDRFVAADLAKALAPRGGLEEARAAWEEALERDSRDSRSWHGYAPLCLFLGKEDAYRRARQPLLERFENNTNQWYIAECNSVACLLLPASGEELRRTAASSIGPWPTGSKFVRSFKSLPPVHKRIGGVSATGPT